MVVLGTKPEYFNAVWVKNEWSRYLALIRAGADKVLVPAYRDMDPYDLPEEFSHLQAQDMGKLGFMQDLIRGIRKLTAKEEASSPQPVVQRTAAGTNVENLMKRVHLFMEDGDAKSAKEYLDKVLDENAEYAPAYVCLVCNDCGFRNEEMLRKATFLFEDHPDWQKAMRFAAPDQRKIYEDWQAEVRERVNGQISQYACDCAAEMAVRSGADRKKLERELDAYRETCQWDTVRRSDGSRRVNGEKYDAAFQQVVQSNEPGDISEEQLKTAADMFEATGNDEALKFAGQCRMLAEQARQKNIYKTAKTDKLQGRSAVRLEEAAKGFLSVPEYKDARVLAQQCLDEAAKIREEKYSKVVSQMKDANDSQKWKEVVERLSEEDLNGYREVEQLRQQASQQYKKIIEDQEQERAKSRREAEAAAARKKRNKIIAAVMAVVAVAMFFIITKVIIPGINYRNAVTLQRAGNYEDAIEAFTALGEYSDSEIQVKESRYLQAMAMMKTGNYEAAIEAFKALEDYSDSEVQVKESRYQQAMSMIKEGNYVEAYVIMGGIHAYKDVDDLLETDADLLAAAGEGRRRALKIVGSYVTFGTYPQTKDGTDETPIEWLVLDVQGDKSLLISRYALDCQPYNTEKKGITWEKCALRTWLNSEFVNKAFSADEQKAILMTQVDNSNSQGYSDYDTSGGNNTQDKIFLLSYAEAWKYFADDASRKCAPTDYAVAQGGNNSSSKQVDGKATCWWWLRSPGDYQDNAASVRDDGSRGLSYVRNTNAVVRPAFWINLESNIF